LLPVNYAIADLLKKLLKKSNIIFSYGGTLRFFIKRKIWYNLPINFFVWRFAMNTYRRLRDSDGPWHFCANCSQFPESNKDERLEIPEGGEPCQECTELREAGNCD
jgi:hypothetical protein